MGAKLRETRRRIRGVQSTMKITRAMELIATSRIVKAQQRVVAARPYAERIQQALKELAGISEAKSQFPLLQAREQTRTVGVLVITSDRGLAGGYNSSVIRVAERIIREAQRNGQGYRLHIVGKKGVSYFRFRGYDIASSVQGVSDTPRYEDAEAVGRRLIDEFSAGESDQVLVAYTNFRSAGSQRALSTQVLPIVKEDVELEPGTIPPLYEFEPEPAAILELLLPRYVITIVYAAMLESSASEHAARRRAMKTATENAQELLGDLTRVANLARQSEITTEIMDIVGGAEALRKQAQKASV
ncbi:MAG: F0F1 ATP synthase subunit gamma [Actinomycetota bacterium]|nr:F0F1 ATP synthase subunit gamma [Actinomycetota bacterium]